MMSAGFTASAWRKSSRSNSDQACVEVAQGVAWRKSSRSNSDQECVEVAQGVAWRKSTRSSSDQDCVEVGQVSAAVGVRDSKDPEGGHIAMERAAFGDLVAKVKAGDLDL